MDGTRKTRKTSYVSRMLKSLQNLSRIWTEKRYEERVRASRSLGFSRFLGGLFSCAKPPKHSFSRLTRFSRRPTSSTSDLCGALRGQGGTP